MRELIEKLKAEKTSIEMKKSETQKCQSEVMEEAYRTGIRIAAKWIRGASYQEIKDVVKRPNANQDASYFSRMRSIFFTSLENICPSESKRFKWVYNDAFLKGWREEVNNIWESIKDEINR